MKIGLIAATRPTASHTQPAQSGWGGIRTHGSLSTTPVFKTGALNHSATHPLQGRRRRASLSTPVYSLRPFAVKANRISRLV